MRWQLDGRKVKLRDARGRRRELLLLLLLLCLLQEHGRHSEVIASHTRRLGCLLCLRHRRLLLLLLYLLQLLHLPQLLLLAFPFFLLACFSRELVEEVLPLQGATLPGGGLIFKKIIIIFLQRPAEFAEVVESTSNATTAATAEEAVLRRVRYARHG